MINSKKFLSLGLMSGTSADGIDIGLLKTDGESYIKLGPTGYYSFSKLFSKKIKSVFKTKMIMKEFKSLKRIKEIESEFTELNFKVIKKFLKKNKINKEEINVIGFHGQTISHNPSKGYSWQIGDSKELSNLLNIKVVGNFRENDIKNGGQGAPLTPIFHFFLTKKINKRICFVNLGGISNVTYFDHKYDSSENNILAFDAGPCCSLIDDWVSQNSRKLFDNFGNLGKKGVIKKKIVEKFLMNPYFKKIPPKSLDRSFFSLSLLQKLKLEDGAATLTDLVSETLLKSCLHFPNKPDVFIFSGGGRLNKFLLKMIKNKFSTKNIFLTENYNWNGDAIEAYAFGYLAVRKLLNLPITFPKTTGVKKPLTGGNIFNL